MGGTQVKDRFKWDTNALFTWDYGVDNVPYNNDLLNFNCQIVDILGIEGAENQVKPEFIDEGEYQIMFGFQLYRGTNSSIYDDYKAQSGSPDKHFLFKIFAGSTKYLQLEAEDVGLSQCRANYAHHQGTDKTLPVWDVLGLAENVIVKGKDSLHGVAAQQKYYGE